MSGGRDGDEDTPDVPVVPRDRDPAWEARESGPVPLPLGKRRLGRDREVTTGTHRRLEVQKSIDKARALNMPSARQLLDAVLSLGRRVNALMDETEIVRAHVDTYCELLPGRCFTVRLLDPTSAELTLLLSTLDPPPASDGAVRISREALVRHCVPESEWELAGVQITENYAGELEGTHGGFDVPIMDGTRLVGVLAVTYANGEARPSDDPSVVGRLAVSMGASLRDARLVRESLYLRDYLAKLLDHANVPIIVIGASRRIEVASRAVLELMGLERDELVGQDFLRMLPEGERSRILPAFANALRGVPTENFDVGLPRKGGAPVPVSMNVASILGPGGEVEGVICVGRDLSRVRDLEEQVVQAEKLATLGQLAAGVVHELNNPLTSISVYGEYLLDQGEKTGAPHLDVERLRRIVQSADRILRFTRDLVVYARPASEAPQPVIINQVLDQSLVFCEHIIDEHGAIVVRDFPDEELRVWGVKGQLHQVFINLITNACHAMPEGAGRLSLRVSSDAGNRVHISVKDNGSGIPADQVKVVFEPFFSTKGEGKGTGLGLSIVKNIVQQHGGGIEVESMLGDGATFTVTLLTRRD